MSGELMPRILTLPVGEEDAGKTIKEYLMQKIGFSSRQLSRFKYRKEGILVNGERKYVTAVLQAGDILRIRLTQGGDPSVDHPSGHAPRGSLMKIWAPPAQWLTQRHPLKILYEDGDILAADKPPGVVCHPSPGHFDDTLSNQVAEHLGRTGKELDVRVTGRLDRDTSGIVVFALNTETAAQLIKQRTAGTMDKLYIARVKGHFGKDGQCAAGSGGCGECTSSGTVDAPLRRESADSFRMVISDDGKAAKTHYRVLREYADGTSLISCRIEHGRTHQIRVHMASIGHPLAGDILYGQASDGPPLMLHAFRMKLLQPFTGEEIRLEAKLPDWAADQDQSVRGRAP